MAEPVSLFTLAVNALTKSAPYWIHALENTAQNKGKELTILQSKKFLDKRQYEKHMHSVLENAAMKGIVQFQALAERDQYRAVIQFLAQEGPNKEELLNEALSLLTLPNKPDFSKLTEKYNLRERIKSLAQHTEYKDVDVTPYLTCFFENFRDELFADDLFKQQVSNVIIVRSGLEMQQSLTEIATALPSIKDAVTHYYSDGEFAQNLQTYLAHIERSLRYLKIVGIVPKDQNTDPQLDGIFVPLRINLHGKDFSTKENEGASIVATLEQQPCLALLGGPGSGKSTATKYLAWSHALARLSDTSSSPYPLLTGKPVPLRIELRRLSNDRRSFPDYTFLSYTEVLLRREGIEINSKMFKRLLADKNMLLLFDGLDEVTTLEERKQLVEEIEGFIGNYPGNYVIVTSRPVGYELGRLSNQLFREASILDFGDAQIQQFLERWYTYMLRLSPIPDRDRQELEELFKTLKENPRLHKLAENPLLLTVITPLHRYERLPDKRVQVYDRCADILLETWAKLRGTKARWQDIQLSKDDQYACVAYIGFVLHKRSQEYIESDTEATLSQSYSLMTNIEDSATDVPTKFILKEIKHFLSDRNLITEVKAQNIESERFLELMQVEAGLIVERGTNQYNESLYGFVHRTFQEYFAAADIYERYQQEVDLDILSDFLRKYLHDPHWREVILLLLGKLKRKPVTVLLRQILDGKIKSRRSHFAEILQHDLFFICDCLTEDIAIENDLVDIVILHLSQIMKFSPFGTQIYQAAEYLSKLMQNRQYTKHAKDAYNTFIAETTHNVENMIIIASTIYHTTSIESESKHKAFNVLYSLAQDANLPIKYRIDSAHALLYPLDTIPFSFPEANLVRDTEDTRQMRSILLNLAQDTNLPIGNRIQAANISNFIDATFENKQQVVHTLLDFVQDTNLSVENRINAANFAFSYSSKPEDLQQVVHTLLNFVQDTNLSVENRIDATNTLLNFNSIMFEKKQPEIYILLNLAKDTNLSVEHRIHAIRILNYSRSTELNIKQLKQQVRDIALNFMQDANLPVNYRIQSASILITYMPTNSKNGEDYLALHFLWNLANDDKQPIEERIAAVRELTYERIAERSFDDKVYQQANQLLLKFMLDKNLTIDQRLLAAERFISAGNSSINTINSNRVKAMLLILDMLNDNAITQYFEKYWEHFHYYFEEDLAVMDISNLINLSQKNVLPNFVRNNVYEVLKEMIPKFNQITNDL